ncbi:LysR substrate-binding domain-containing protein [Devosia sp. ZB163]|uniref:LysR substrate-binding domain-containing protein n=1 Tax=Devosia sp. ZB163 TaxID=3025938 RepID=UPI00235FB5BF|nr:LysR substrate-binding domain-containing protein [Devosia sp. ZB163]MDC9822820.1 LysR substrate-binding domain-containing protein [Devosia sp. ZB163]
MASPFPIPLNALRAIEIVARRGALAPAAEELGVTPGAVSQHLRRAEERLGVELFERTPQGLRPTAALRQVLPRLTGGFDALADAVSGLAVRDEHVLTLTVGSVFASRWLIWRIAKFNRLHPEIEVRLVVTGTMIDLAHSDIDAGIRFGRGSWPGLRSELVGGVRYRPVAAPPVAALLKQPADLARVPLIRDTSSMLPWEPWFEKAGIAPMELTGPRYDDPTLAFDAAISEQGVLMAVGMMSADAVSDGRLVRPFDIHVDSDVGYWMIVAEGRREPKKVRLFRDWLRSEVPDSAEGYVAQVRRAKG